ncbi:MAG TPA: hypothetical protein VLY83_03765 [Methanoregula sp.]|nr:hypothetical protein [Methanoregula sp.]
MSFCDQTILVKRLNRSARKRASARVCGGEGGAPSIGPPVARLFRAARCPVSPAAGIPAYVIAAVTAPERTGENAPAPRVQAGPAGGPA